MKVFWQVLAAGLVLLATWSLLFRSFTLTVDTGPPSGFRGNVIRQSVFIECPPPALGFLPEVERPSLFTQTVRIFERTDLEPLVVTSPPFREPLPTVIIGTGTITGQFIEKRCRTASFTRLWWSLGILVSAAGVSAVVWWDLRYRDRYLEPESGLAPEFDEDDE